MLSQTDIRRRFDRAAATFDDADFVHTVSRVGLLARLEPLLLEPKTILDLGCATGALGRLVRKRFRRAHVVSLDLSTVELTSLSDAMQPNAATVLVGRETLDDADVGVHRRLKRAREGRDRRPDHRGQPMPLDKLAGSVHPTRRGGRHGPEIQIGPQVHPEGFGGGITP